MKAPRQLTAESWQQARSVLEVSEDAGEAELHAAYLAKVRQHSPDRDPEMFERIRDAYEQLRDPRLRAMQVLGGPDPVAPLETLLQGHRPPRRFVGPDLWLGALKEKRT